MALEIFITGATGYLGRALIPRLVGRGHRVRALIRAGSEGRSPGGCVPIIGDPLKKDTFAESVMPCETFVQLVGTPRPAPWKGREFRAIDLVSARQSIAVARRRGAAHFIYVSVAHPAPVMKAYIAVRAECERLLRDSGLPHTIVRPWYITGPGHRWPILFEPLYRLFESLPATRASAERLGLVTIEEMTEALLWAIEHPPTTSRLLTVRDIRTVGRTCQ